MKLLRSEKRPGKYSFFLVLAVLALSLFTTSAFAQSKKAKAAPKSKKTAPAKKATAAAPKKGSAKTTAKAASTKKAPAKKAKPLTAAERRKEAQRKKAEEARRRAALAEQRRREQAAREARARKIAFERGLRTETAENILKDNTEGEDLAVRKVAVEALGEKAGTVVVMEAKTGRVVTMVNQDWAIKHGFKPCSTIKLVTGVAGVNEKLIDGEGNITGNSMRMTLDDALARSNNPYFQRVGSDLGNEKMIDYAKRLGLGQRTGINAEGENPGKLPYGNKNLRIYSHADDFEVTPLQLAVMVTALSNGGKRVVPTIQKTQAQKAALKPKYHGSIDLPEYSYQRVLPGMMGAAEYGTARRGVDPALGIAGKTGSCIGRGSWVGLFASVAPVEDPKYAVVVITRGESERGRNAAAIAGQIYRALAPTISRDQEKNLAIRRLTSLPPPNAIPSTLAEAGTGDDEDDDDESAVPAADRDIDARRPVVVAGAQQQKKDEPGRVVRTGQSNPVFSPVVIGYDKTGAEDGTAKPAAAAKNKPSGPTASAADKRSTTVSSKPVVVSSAPPTAAKTPAARPAVKSAVKPATKPAAKPASAPAEKKGKSVPAKAAVKPAASKSAAPASKSSKAPAGKSSTPAKGSAAAKGKTAPAKSKAAPAAKKPAAASKAKDTKKAPAAKKPADKSKKADTASKSKEGSRPRVVKRK
ncbi:MAG: hypothetical protein KF855_01625 [Acidobacteria bacterium]|nr:hypothetical protein [Acidobacteriota bacterium]